MEKKKLKKLKINKMSEFPVIGDQEQMMMKGGYTFAQMEQMIDAGTWSGGQVDGIGYVGGVANVYGGNILPYANLQFSGTDNELSYAVETLANAGAIIYNGVAWGWNRTGAQWSTYGD